MHDDSFANPAGAIFMSVDREASCQPRRLRRRLTQACAISAIHMQDPALNAKASRPDAACRREAASSP
jgi:hypothetical protein